MENNELLLSLSIYNRQSIKAAIKAYQDLAKISVAETSDTAMLHFDNCRYDLAITKHEFTNYLINLENAKIN